MGGSDYDLLSICTEIVRDLLITCTDILQRRLAVNEVHGIHIFLAVVTAVALPLVCRQLQAISREDSQAPADLSAMKKAGKTGKTLSFQGANRKVGFSLVNYEEYADSIRDGGMNVFADVDDNHDGVITKAELMNHIGEGSDASMRLGSMSRLDVVSTFDDMDLNGDGVITPLEMKAALQNSQIEEIPLSEREEERPERHQKLPSRNITGQPGRVSRQGTSLPSTPGRERETTYSLQPTELQRGRNDSGMFSCCGSPHQRR